MPAACGQFSKLSYHTVLVAVVSSHITLLRSATLQKHHAHSITLILHRDTSSSNALTQHPRACQGSFSAVPIFTLFFRHFRSLFTQRYYVRHGHFHVGSLGGHDTLHQTHRSNLVAHGTIRGQSTAAQSAQVWTAHQGRI